MIIWPCRLNSSGSKGLMLEEEVWLATLSELRLPIINKYMWYREKDMVRASLIFWWKGYLL